MPTSTTEHIDVDVPVEQAFEYVADLSNLAEWDPTFKRSEAVDDRPLGVGKRFVVVAETGMAIDYEVVEYEPHRRVVFLGTNEKLTSRDEVDVRPADDGTRITWDATVETDAPDLVETLATPLFAIVGKAAAHGLATTLEHRHDAA